MISILECYKIDKRNSLRGILLQQNQKHQNSNGKYHENCTYSQSIILKKFLIFLTTTTTTTATIQNKIFKLQQIQRTKKLNVLFAIGAILIALYAIFVYGILTEWVVPLGSAVDPNMQRQFKLQKPAIYIHALSSAIALAIGPFQVLAYFRSKYLEAHRWAGRAYVIFATIGSVTGVIVAQKAQGGIPAVISFSALGVLWLISTLVGYVAIAFLKNIWLHELSMQTSVALSYSAVSLRILLPIAIFTDFQLGYAIVSWLSWTINLLVLYILRQTCKADQNLQSTERLQA